MKGMTGIVKKVTQLIAGFMFVYGFYILLHGHLTPGGGFAGGAIIAGSFILVVLAFGSDYFGLLRREKGSAISESLAILAFLLVAVLGFFLGLKVFFSNYLGTGTVGQLVSAGIIPICNILIGIEVATALMSIFFAFVIYKEEQQ